MTHLLSICHRCPERHRPCAGACPCKIDGADIIEHAREEQCPRGYYDGVPQPADSVPIPMARRIEPIPRGDWPLKFKMMGMAESHADAGVGDTVYRLAVIFGADWLTKKVKWLGDCGCADRRKRWNQLYPYR